MNDPFKGPTWEKKQKQLILYLVCMLKYVDIPREKTKQKRRVPSLHIEVCRSLLGEP